MKKLAFLIVWVVLVTTGSAAVPVDSVVTHATVFLDRALVTRTAKLDLSAGEHELVFHGLPVSLVDGSVQVDGRSTSNLFVLDVNTRSVFLEVTPDARVRELEEHLRELRWKMRSLEDRRAVLTARKDAIDRIVLASTHRPSEGPGSAGGPEDWDRLLTFVDQGLQEVAAGRREVEEEMEHLRARIEAAENQLRSLRGSNRKAVKEVVVRVALDRPASGELALSYQVPNARWTPAYDVRLNGSNRSVSLSYFGVVRQATGEDWNQVQLTLSTARPSLGGSAPDVRPWYVDQFAKPVPEPPAPLMRAPSVFSKDYDEVREEGLVGVRQQEASVATQLTSVSYTIPAAANIPGDHTPNRVGIGVTGLQARLEYATAPKLLPSAFLQAKVTNSSDLSFLAGPMSVFLDGRFVSTSNLRSTFPGEEFELDLGADEAIRVERKLINRFTEDLGFISRKKRVTYDILLTLENTKRTAEKIHLRDHLPVSRNENITVKLLRPSEKDLVVGSDGLFTWTLDLNAGEKRELPLRFAIEYPADWEISGLE